jgi:hypothetical protein
MEVTKWLKPSVKRVTIGDCANGQAATCVNAEQALYGLSKSSPYATTISAFFIQVSLFDEAARFFVPTHLCLTQARAGPVKAGRGSALALRSVVSRPRLDRPEHGGMLPIVGTRC